MAGIVLRGKYRNWCEYLCKYWKIMVVLQNTTHALLRACGVIKNCVSSYSPIKSDKDTQ